MLDRFSRSVAQIVPIGALFLFHGLLSLHSKFAVIGVSIALTEWSVFQLIWAGLTWNQFQIVRNVFTRYPTCTFRLIPRESYFKGGQAYSHIDIYQDDRRLLLEPHYIALYHFQGPGECIESPTFLETGVSPVIFLTDLPIGNAANNRFLILHEIGHQSDLAGPPVLFRQLLALSHIPIVATVLFLVLGWSWHVAIFAFALVSLYWYEGLRLVLELCYDDLRREIIADEHAIRRLSLEDCATVKETFKSRFEHAAAAPINGRVSDLKRPLMRGRFEESDGVVRRYSGLDQLLRRLKGEAIEGFSLAQSPNQLPVYFAVTLFLLYASSLDWRWLQPTTVGQYLSVAVALLSFVACLYLRVVQERRLRWLLKERAPLITADELTTAERSHEARRKGEEEFNG